MTDLIKAAIALAHAEYLIGAFERGADSSECDRDISDFWEMLATLRAALDEESGEEQGLFEFVAGFLADYQSEEGLYDMKHYAKKAHELVAKVTKGKEGGA